MQGTRDTTEGASIWTKLVKGYSLSTEGARGTAQGTRGTPQDTRGTTPDTRGTPPDTRGTPPDTRGTPPDTRGTPQGTRGTPPDTRGTPQAARGTSDTAERANHQGPHRKCTEQRQVVDTGLRGSYVHRLKRLYDEAAATVVVRCNIRGAYESLPLRDYTSP